MEKIRKGESCECVGWTNSAKYNTQLLFCSADINVVKSLQRYVGQELVNSFDSYAIYRHVFKSKGCTEPNEMRGKQFYLR